MLRVRLRVVIALVAVGCPSVVAAQPKQAFLRGLVDFVNAANGARLVTTDGLGSFQVNVGTSLLTLTDFQAVPEPSTWLLMAIGAAGCALRLRQRRRS